MPSHWSERRSFWNNRAHSRGQNWTHSLQRTDLTRAWVVWSRGEWMDHGATGSRSYNFCWWLHLSALGRWLHPYPRPLQTQGLLDRSRSGHHLASCILYITLTTQGHALVLRSWIPAYAGLYPTGWMTREVDHDPVSLRVIPMKMGIKVFMSVPFLDLP